MSESPQLGGILESMVDHCISFFLRLLRQSITNWVAADNRNLFSHLSADKSGTKVSEGP